MCLLRYEDEGYSAYRTLNEFAEVLKSLVITG